MACHGTCEDEKAGCDAETTAREGGGGSVTNVGVLPVPMLPISNWGLKLVGVWRRENRFGILLGERKTVMATKCRHYGSTSCGHGCAYGAACGPCDDWCRGVRERKL